MPAEGPIPSHTFHPGEPMRRRHFMMIAGILTLASCASDTPPATAPLEGGGARPRATADAGPCGNCVVGPVTLTRGTGAPVETAFEFEGDPAAGYMLDVTDIGSQGLTGSVVLNGTPIVPQEEFRSNGGMHIHRPVAVAAHNRLTVRLEGKPGATLAIELRSGVQVLGASGGILRAPGGSPQIEIPAGALSGETELSIVRTAHPVTSDFLGEYDLRPSGTTFNLPVTLVFSVTPVQRAAAGPGAWPIVVMRAQPSDTTWTPVTGWGFDSLTNRASAPLGHFSSYALVYLTTQDVNCARFLYGTYLPFARLNCRIHGPDLSMSVGSQVQTALLADVDRLFGPLWLMGVFPSCENVLPPRSSCLPLLTTRSTDPTITGRSSTGMVRGYRAGVATLEAWYAYNVEPEGSIQVTVTGGNNGGGGGGSGGSVGSGAATDVNINNFKLALGRGVFPPGMYTAPAAVYKNSSALFGGGLIVGVSPSEVMVGYDVRGRLPPGFRQDTPLQLVPAGQRVADHETATALCSNSFQTALGYGVPAGLTTVQETFAYAEAPDDDYVLVRYTFFNSGIAPLSNLYAALVLDWDIPEGSRNLSRLDAVDQTALAYYAVFNDQEPSSATPLVGVLSTTSLDSYDPFVAGGDPNSPSSWFAAISGGMRPEVLSLRDIRHLAGVGPFSIPPGTSVSHTFALVGGDNLPDLAGNAAAARRQAATLPPYQGSAPVCQ